MTEQLVPEAVNFKIVNSGVVSDAFSSMGVRDFEGAANYIRQLPYGRNANKLDLLTVFTDGCGTCSTKHALLKLLANEQGIGHEVELVMGIIKMNAENTPRVKHILEQHNLPYIPEAHMYLKLNGEVLDYTASSFATSGHDKDDVISETSIEPQQITDYKVSYQKAFMKWWLEEHPEIPYSLDELFAIREACIKALG
jgi:hypothetical protein